MGPLSILFYSLQEIKVRRANSNISTLFSYAGLAVLKETVFGMFTHVPRLNEDIKLREMEKWLELKLKIEMEKKGSIIILNIIE